MNAILEPFPKDCLPENLRRFVEAVAANVQVAPDMVAVPLLATLCVPLQNRFVVRIDSTYTEPLCLYTLTIARPSERKSAIMSILERPLWDFQQEAKKTEEEMEAAKPIWNQTPLNKRKPLTLYVTDATPEKLAKLMTENNGAIAILSDEPDALSVAAGLRYGKSRNLGLMLQAWSAGHIIIQRATEDRRISIDRAVMSVVVMSQPSFVESLMKDAEMSDRGFMQRFLYAKPLSQVGKRSFFKPEIPESVISEYNSLIKDFLCMKADNLRELRLSEKAKTVAAELFHAIEAGIENERVLEGWMGKLFGQSLRLAGVLHCAKWGVSAAEHEIDAKTMTDVLILANYFRSHASAVFTDIDVTEAQRDAQELYRRMYESGRGEFMKSDLYKLTSGNMRKKRLEAALVELIATNYIMPISDAADEKKWKYVLADGRGELDESEAMTAENS